MRQEAALSGAERWTRGELVEVLPGVQVYPNVEIGEGVTLDPPLVLGKPPRGKEPGELRLVIGAGSVIRPFTTIYAGTILGAGVQTGQCVSIREDNEIGDGASVGTGSILEFSNRIGARSRIHSGCFLEMTIVEEDVFVGPRVVFTDDPHPMGCPRYKECLGGVTVRALARIGANCTLLPGVVVGRNSLVGAGSVVTRHVPDDMVVAGNPARIIKAVADLTCSAGFFARPYEWAPYKKP